MSANAFERIMASLETADDGVSEKTAAAQASPDTSARMLQTVQTLSRANQQAKTASAGNRQTQSVAGDLQRMAKEAQAAENEQMVKQAHFLGSAVCDGFMERFAQYDSALSAAGHKTAAVQPGNPGNDDYIQKVAQAAYQKAVEDMQKTAAADYQKGYDDTLEYVHKVASDMHYIGQQAAQALIQAGRQQ